MIFKKQLWSEGFKSANPSQLSDDNVLHAISGQGCSLAYIKAVGEIVCVGPNMYIYDAAITPTQFHRLRCGNMIRLLHETETVARYVISDPGLSAIEQPGDAPRG